MQSNCDRSLMRLLFRHIFALLLSTVVGVPSNATEERVFTVINAADGLADNSAQALVCTKTGRMVISTLGNINFYNGSEFTYIVTRREFSHPLQQYRGSYRLYFDRRHHLWLKNAGSITCTDLIQEQFTLNTDSVLRELKCPMPVLDLFTDSLGHIWTLSDDGLYGVEQDRVYNVLRNSNLQEVDVFDDMLITFYGNGEEVAQSISTGKTVHRTKAYDWDTAQRFSNTSALLRHGDGYFQLRSGDKESVLLYFDVRRQLWTTLMEKPFHMNSMALKDGCLYIATQHGYCIYNIATREQEWIEELAIANGGKIKADCIALAFDRQGGLWIGTRIRGLLYSQPIVSPFKSISLDTPQAHRYVEMMQEMEQNITEFQGLNANCLFTDSRGWSWIGTTTGLYMYKDPHQQPIVFSRKSGFYNDVIHSVVEDASHNVWVATSAGLSFIRFKGEEVEFVNSFDANDYVPAEAFINSKAMLLPDSQIVMQTIDHVLIFNPENFDFVNKPQPYSLLPKLSRLMVNGNIVEPNTPIDGNIIIDRAISRVSVINLKSDQKTLSLVFSPLNYFRPLQSYYHVRIKGLGDETWQTYSYHNSNLVDNKGMLHLPLFDLQPGNYAIEIQASMFPDKWEGEPFRWEIVVNQSWWQAKGMYYLYAVLLLMLVFANIYVYIRNTRMRVRRNHEEGDIISKICMFVWRADSMDSERLAPQSDELSNATSQHLQPEFIDIMQKLMPLVRESRKKELSMHKLSDMANVDIVHLYEVITANIYKSPREMIKQVRLRKAAEQLVKTDKTVEQISDECGFYTPNYFMGNFFHEYKRTPAEYREEKR